MRNDVLIKAFCLLLPLLAAGAVQAQDDEGWRTHDRVNSGQILPLDRILPEIRRAQPGRFFDAQGPFADGDGQMHYRLKWMTPEGRIIWIDADARTGRVLGVSGGRNFGDGY